MGAPQPYEHNSHSQAAISKSKRHPLVERDPGVPGHDEVGDGREHQPYDTAPEPVRLVENHQVEEQDPGATIPTMATQTAKIVRLMIVGSMSEQTTAACPPESSRHLVDVNR